MMSSLKYAVLGAWAVMCLLAAEAAYGGSVTLASGGGEATVGEHIWVSIDVTALDLAGLAGVDGVTLNLGARDPGLEVGAFTPGPLLAGWMDVASRPPFPDWAWSFINLGAGDITGTGNLGSLEVWVDAPGTYALAFDVTTPGVATEVAGGGETFFLGTTSGTVSAFGTKTWVGGTGAWYHAENWDPVGVPDNWSDVTIDAGDGEAGVEMAWMGSSSAAHIQTSSTADGQVWLRPEPFTPVVAPLLVVPHGLTNSGNLSLERLELQGDMTNHGSVELTEMEVAGDIHNHPEATLAVFQYTNVVDDGGVGGNLANDGKVRLVNGASLNVEGAVSNAPSGRISGSGELTVGGGLSNEGQIASESGDLSIVCEGGAPFTQTGAITNAVGTSVHVQAQAFANAGTITVNTQGAVTFACDLVNPAGGTVTLLGGAIAAPNIAHQAGAALGGTGSLTGDLTNEGTIDFFGPVQVFGQVQNKPGALLGVRNGNLLVTGHTVNEGGATIKVTNGQAYFEGGLTSSGEVDIDPALAVFVGDLVVTPDGFVVADAGSTVQIMRNLLSASTRAADWDTGGAELVARIGGSATHVVSVTGEDRGAVPAGWTDNFAWGRLKVETGQAVELTDSGSPGRALYLHDLAIDAGARMRLNDVNLYLNGTLTGGGSLDMTAANLVVDYDGASPIAEMAAMLASGCNGGAWDGLGIHSSDAAAGVLTAVGVLDNTDPKWGGRPDFEGKPVDPTAVLVKYTWWGDANLDGVVDANDYDVIDKAYLFTPTPALPWFTGDFNYDGVIDANDYDRIDKTYLFQAGPLGGERPAATPEPTTMGLLAVGLTILSRRVRRER